MQKTHAEQIITDFVKPIYGFALKNCRTPQDAEDLSQEIILRAYRTLLLRDDIAEPRKFIWTIAHNALANYYRERAGHVGVSIDDIAETLPGDDDIAEEVAARDTAEHLRREIAYLSRLQRRIVIAYYYENRRQSDIAAELGIPEGTVKWHLFEAKKDLKRGMETMRNASELKFNPVSLAGIGTSGSVGKMGGNHHFLRSTLSQNIVYAVRSEAKTVGEIADALGVSPVYIEGEAEYLEEHGFLTKSRNLYLCNILLEENTPALTRMHDEMYKAAAALVAPKLADALEASGLLDDPDIVHPGDRNFLLWTLIPYILAWSGEGLLDCGISFEEAATLRPDGGHNICYAHVDDPAMPKPAYADSMDRWCGPCWNQNDGLMLWLIDSEWTEKRVDDAYHTRAGQILKLLARMDSGELSRDDCAFLCEQGCARMEGGRCVPACVWLRTERVNRALIAIGDAVKQECLDALKALKAPFEAALLRAMPKQLHVMQRYVLQFLFGSDGWFLLHALKALIDSGRLTPPEEAMRKSLTMLVVRK